MTSGGRRKSIAFFIVLGACLVGGALALNVGWIIVSWRNVGLLIVGIVVFPLIITGVVLNTIFLVREIRRNEQHDAFINAVTHELKTPVASMRLLPADAAESSRRRGQAPGVLQRDARRTATGCWPPSNRCSGPASSGRGAGRSGHHADRPERARRRSACRSRGLAIGCRRKR